MNVMWRMYQIPRLEKWTGQWQPAHPHNTTQSRGCPADVFFGCHHSAVEHTCEVVRRSEKRWKTYPAQRLRTSSVHYFGLEYAIKGTCDGRFQFAIFIWINVIIFDIYQYYQNIKQIHLCFWNNELNWFVLKYLCHR